MNAAQKRVKAGWLSGAGLSIALLLGLNAPVLSPSAQAATQVRVSSWTYDSAGMIATETIEPDDAQFTLTTTYTYDAFGNKIAVTVSSPATGDAAIAPRTTSTTYTADGRFPATVTNALNQSETRVYHPAFGGLTSQTGPNGLTTSWEYDGFGRKILETRPDGTKTKWEYLWCSGYNGGTLNTCPGIARYAIVTTPLANDGTTQVGPKSLQYMDMLEREVRVETQGWASAAEPAKAIYADTEYDSFGRVYRKSRPYYAGESPTWTSFEYDAIGRVIRENRPQEEADGTPAVKQVNIAYAGLVTTVTNEWNEQRVTTKNSQGQTIAVKNGRDDGGTSVFTTNTYAYDPFGNLMTVDDGMGNSVSFSYDKRGRKVAMSDPDKGAWSYVYDALGQLKRQTDAKSQTTEIAYDLLGRATAKVIKKADTSVEQTDTWVYDTAPYGVGKLAQATATDGNSAVIHSRTQAYDSLGRPQQTSLTQNGSTNYYTLSYDSLSRLASLQYPSGLTLDYSYSSLSELTQVTNATTQAAVWTLTTRNAARQLTAEAYGNGVLGARSYEAGRGLVKTIQASKDSTVLQAWTITYDSVGNVTGRAEAVTGVVDSLDYDPLNRLIAATTTTNGSPTSTLTMQYVGGNITYKSDVGDYSYPAAGSARPHAVSGIIGIEGQPNRSYAYDDNGNMLTGDGRTFVWNAFDMPVSIAKGGNSVSFAYDADHHRIAQTTPTDIKHYLTDPVTGAKTERKLSLAGAHLRWDSYITIQGELVSLVTKEAAQGETPENTIVRYFHRDHLSSTTLLTDEAGNVVERLSYDVWGKRRFTTGAPDLSDSIVASLDRGYTGHEHIEELALIHMNGRLYDPTIARMVSADPIIADPYSTLAFNRFAYVDNNPMTYTDPTGYWKIGRIIRSILAPFTMIPGVKNLLKNDIVAAIYTAGMTFFAGPLGAAQAAAVVTSVRGGELGDMFKAAVLSFVSSGIGQVGSPVLSAAWGCASASMSGGNCGRGALASGVMSIAGAAANGMNLGDIGRGIANILISSAGSKIGSGSWKAGAISAAATLAFQYMYKEMGRVRQVEIVSRGSEDEPKLLAPDMNLAGANDAFGASAANVPADPEGRYVLVGHGYPDGMAFGPPNGPSMSVGQVASKVRGDSNWGMRDVLLLSCNTGVSSGYEHPFAQQLANELGVNVYAPNNFIWAWPNGNTVIAPPVSPANATWRTPAEEMSGGPDRSRTGVFLRFTPQQNEQRW